MGALALAAHSNSSFLTFFVNSKMFVRNGAVQAKIVNFPPRPFLGCMSGNDSLCHRILKTKWMIFVSAHCACLITFMIKEQLQLIRQEVVENG